MTVRFAVLGAGRIGQGVGVEHPRVKHGLKALILAEAAAQAVAAWRTIDIDIA